MSNIRGSCIFSYMDEHLPSSYRAAPFVENPRWASGFLCVGGVRRYQMAHTHRCDRSVDRSTACLGEERTFQHVVAYVFAKVDERGCDASPSRERFRQPSLGHSARADIAIRQAHSGKGD